MFDFISGLFQSRKKDDLSVQEDLPLANRSVHLTVEQNDYAVELCFRNPWLQDRSFQLEETIVHIVSKVKGGEKLFKTLINRFHYVSKIDSDKRVKLLVDQIEEQWKVPRDNTVIMAFCKNENGHGDGSQALLNDLKTKMNKWKENQFYSQFDIENVKIKSGNNVILIDDFVGSGETIVNRVEAIKAVMSKKAKLYVASLGATKVSRLFMSNYFPQVAFYSPVYVKRGFDPRYSFKKKEIMFEMEGLLSPKYKNYKLERYSLGYNQTCAVYYNDDYRIPNNVFPVFWWGKLKTGENYNSLFLRT